MAAIGEFDRALTLTNTNDDEVRVWALGKVAKATVEMTAALTAASR